MDQELYSENVIDHGKYPRNKRSLPQATFSERASNPSCGDEITLHLFLDNNVVQDISFEGSGCAISVAGASLLTEKLKGKNVNDALLLSPGDIYSMLGIKISPGRVNCALLSYKALGQVLQKYENK